MTAELLTEKRDNIGVISLNRPKAIHALNLAMVEAMIAALLQWQHDDTVQAVIIEHSEGRGFCSGGDIAMLQASGQSDGVEGRRFFYREYQLNHLLFVYPKPIVAFMDGITMGGGVGIAMPARYRVATENTRFAMPETAIGLFPDVGGGWYLPRLPGRLGQFLALTGARLDGAECLETGIATHYLPPEELDEAKARIAANPSRVSGALGLLSATPPEARIAQHFDLINRLFASEELEEILAALEADDSDWAQKERDTLGTKSPQSCKVSLRQLREGATMGSFADQMRAEYRIASRVLMTHDFAEGVRAVILDKDHDPQWNPGSPEAVDAALLDAIFAPLPPEEEWQVLEELQ